MIDDRLPVIALLLGLLWFVHHLPALLTLERALGAAALAAVAVAVVLCGVPALRTAIADLRPRIARRASATADA